MSLSSSTSRVDFGVTSATNFPFAFKIFSASDLVVQRADSSGNVTTVSPSLYTVNNVGGDTGSIDYPTHSATDLSLTIMRVVDETQPTVLRNQSTFYADVVEKALDRGVMIDQQLQEQLGRAPVLPANFHPTPIPAPTNGMTLGWLSGTWAWVAAATAGLQGILADALSIGNGDALIGVKQPFTGSVGTTQHEVNSRDVSARDFGVPTGVGATDLSIIKAAVSAVSGAGGGFLTIPFGFSQDVINAELAGLGLANNVTVLDQRWGQSDHHWVLFGNGRDNENRVEGYATATGEGPCVVVQNLGAQDGLSGLVTNFSISIATPAVLTATSHGWTNGKVMWLSTTGALPTGLATGTDYYVINAAANTLQLSLTPGGPAINTSGSQSGTQTATEQNKNLTTSIISRSGPKATQKVQGVIKCGVMDSNGVWVNDYDVIPQYYSDLAQSNGQPTKDSTLSRSRVRIGRRGSLLINAGILTKYQDTDAAVAAGVVAAVNVQWPLKITVSSFNIGASTVITASPHWLANDMAITLETWLDPLTKLSPGTLPTGLTAGTVYYIVNKTEFNFQLTATAPTVASGAAQAVRGTPITLGGSSTGTVTINLSTAGAASSFPSMSPLQVQTDGYVHAPVGIDHGPEKCSGFYKIPNGAAASVTIDEKTRYAYITTSAANLTINFPNATKVNDGLIITVVLSAAVGTLTWASSGGSFLGAPAAGSANIPYRFIYSELSGGQWLPW